MGNKANCHFNRQQTEQRRELDDRVHRDRRRVLERIANGVTDNSRCVQLCTLGAQFRLDDLLGVVPCATGVRHEHGLIQTDDRQRDQVADEEERLDERTSQRTEEHGHEDVEHALLCILRTDGNDALAVGNVGLGRAFVKFHVVLDELNGTIGTGRNSLGRSTGEPEDRRATSDQTEQERRVQHRQMADVVDQAIGQQHDDRENHGCRADNRGTDQYRLGRGLEGVTGAIVFFEQFLRFFEVNLDTESIFEFTFDTRNLFNRRQFINRLRVVRYRAVAVNRDRHRAHAEEAESHQAERKDRSHDACLGRIRVNHQRQIALRNKVGTRHQSDDNNSHPERGEVTRRQTSKNVQACAAFARSRNNFLDVAGIGRGEHLDDFRDDRAGERTERNDQGKLPPEVCIDRSTDRDVTDQKLGDNKRQDQRNDRRHPDQRGQRRFEVETSGIAILALHDDLVADVGDTGSDDHHDAHDEDPDQQLNLNGGFWNRQQDEADQRDASNTIGFETVSRRANRVAGIVTGTVSDNTRVARIVFLDLEDDLHQVGTDVGNLGEDAAGDTQRRSTKRFTDGETDEALASQFRRHEQQDAKHHQQFGRDQHHADRDTRLHRNRINRVRLAFERSESGTAVGQRIDPDTEPGNTERTGNTDQGEDQNQRDF